MTLQEKFYDYVNNDETKIELKELEKEAEQRLKEITKEIDSKSGQEKEDYIKSMNEEIDFLLRVLSYWMDCALI